MGARYIRALLTKIGEVQGTLPLGEDICLLVKIETWKRDHTQIIWLHFPPRGETTHAFLAQWESRA